MKTLAFILPVSFLLGIAEAIPQSTQTATWNLSWSANNTSQTGFNVERRPGTTGNFTKIASVGANVTTYADTSNNDPGNTTLCYRVAAYNGAGQGPYSTIQCATSPTVVVPPSNPPVNVTVSVTVTVTP